MKHSANTLDHSHLREKLLNSEYGKYFNDSPDFHFVISRSQEITAVNQAGATFLGVTRDDLAGRNFLEFIAPAARRTVAQRFSKPCNNEIQFFEVELVSATAVHTTVTLLAFPVVYGGDVIGIFGTAYTAPHQHHIARSTSDNQCTCACSSCHTHPAAADFQRMTYIDTRTDLPNRDSFDRDLELLVQGGSAFVLVSADLDRFKNVNDSWGREIGDRLIRLVAHHLRTRIPESATVYRYTGDQFFIILKTADPLFARAFTAELLDMFIAPFNVEGRSIRTGVSAGAAEYPADGHDAETLVKHTEFALSTAKQQGRNRVIWRSDINEPDQQRNADLAMMLREASARGELSLSYQPQVDVRTRNPFGAEALLRWNSPRFGHVPADSFIAIAEQSGLIVEIGSWALTEACTQFVRWSRENVSLPHISVNISMHQFYDPNFIQMVSHALDTTGLHPAQLVLEITESVASQHDLVVQRMREIAAMGVHLALDDFGTGFSSLTTLQEFPLEYLKVDRSFVQHIGPEANIGLAATVLALAKNLGLQSIAEGVESESQLSMLRDMGADVVQGYHIARPLSAPQMSAWLGGAA